MNHDAMPMTDVLESLCVYDARNPLSAHLLDDDDPAQPRDSCTCDNCFYGRDRLALEIIRLRGPGSTDQTR